MTSLPLRDDLRDATPYGAPEGCVRARLNVNENPYPPSPVVQESIATAIAASLPLANRYPEREFPHLRQDLADYLHAEAGVPLDAEQLWAANGSNEVMTHILLAFGGPGRCLIGANPTYSMYPQYARDTFTRYLQVPRRADFSIDVAALIDHARAEQASVVIIASPNNPTGALTPNPTIAEVATSLRGTGPDGSECVVVVDEAYAEFRNPGTPSALELLDEHPNVIVTRTMSKAFAMAWLRLGYAAASSEIMQALRLVRLPYHLSTLTQAAASAALAHREELLARVAEIRQRRDDTAAWLRERGFTVHPSDANFLLYGSYADRDRVCAALAERGILIRGVGPAGHVRVTIGTAAEMALFQQELQEARYAAP